MLAIFDGRVAKRPECMKMPHKNAVSSLKDDLLVNHFTSVYPDSVVIRSKDSFTFAYSLDPTSSSRLPRFQFAHKDNVFCMYQGFIEDFDKIKEDFDMAEIDNEAMLMIQAFQILRLLGQRAPKKPVEDLSGNNVSAAPAATASKNVIEDMSGNCISVIYDSASKLILLSGGTYYDLPIYWGIDSRFNLVVSNNETIIEKACGCFYPFLSGHVYACCKGHTGQEAIFMNKQPETKVDSPDQRTQTPQTVESVTEMILKADMDRSKPSVDYWQPPPNPKIYKINTAAIIFQNGKIGIGVLVRNSKGDVIMAVSRRKANDMVGLCPELQAFMQGLYLAIGFKYRRCVFESGYLNIEKDKEKAGGGGGDVLLSLIENIARQMVECLREFSVRFVSDDANRAARGLAKYAKRNEHTIWEKETPECIAKVIAAERPDASFASSS